MRPATPTTRLEELPHELLLHAFAFLDAPSLHALAAVCPLFRALVTTDSSLQLNIALEEGGLRLLHPVDLSSTPAATLERVQASRNAWLNLAPSLRTSIEVPFVPGSLYELSGGYFFLSVDRGMQRPRTLAYARLPHLEGDPDDYGEWERVTFDEEIMDFAVDVDQDILCFVQLVPAQLDQATALFRQTFRVHFRAMSDGTPHPVAKLPMVEYYIETGVPFVQCTVALQVVGTHIVILFCGRGPAESMDLMSIAIWDWTSGQLKGTLDGLESRVIHTFAMISASQFLLVAPHSNMLEVYAFDTRTTQQPRPVYLAAQFALPTLFLVHAILRSEPASFAASTPHARPRKSFGVDPDKGIISFTLQILTDENESEIQTFISTRRVFTDRIRGLDGQPGVLFVPWEQWRHDTRWDILGRTPNWICHTLGQRYILLDDFDLGHEPSPIRLLDFNPVLLEDVRAKKEAGTLRVPDHVEMHDRASFGAGLPCVEIATKELYMFSGILLDEDRIIGLNVQLGNITSLDVFLMGEVQRQDGILQQQEDQEDIAQAIREAVDE